MKNTFNLHRKPEQEEEEEVKTPEKKKVESKSFRPLLA